ncbi:MAG: hypothetical protein JNN15_03760 [Blastocatellia bacterium]|nr:hypothetical protein [Blastocatellia bacterium]
MRSIFKVQYLICSLLLICSFINVQSIAANIEDKDDKKDKKISKDRQEFLKKLDKVTADQIAELVIFAYGGRGEFTAIRNNGIEEGTIKLFTEDKEVEGKLIRKFIRNDGVGESRTRVDVDLPSQKLTFGYNGYTVWAARDGFNFTPSPEAENSFMASLIHNHDALLRYKEQEATVEKVGLETIVGIETIVLDLTHRNGSKTRYYISLKTYHILHLEYEIQLTAEATPTKFKESFFDFRPVQNTLVPTKTILYENGKPIQEIKLTQIKYHTKLNEDEFLKY